MAPYAIFLGLTTAVTIISLVAFLHSSELLPLICLTLSAISLTVGWILFVLRQRSTSASSLYDYQALGGDESSVELNTLSQQVPARLLTVNDVQWSNTITFMLNGSPITLVNPDPTESLSTFIRDKAGLKGTKLGCEEGGCGACSVVLTTAKSGTISVNACLRPLCAMDGQAVGTVESLGSIKGGLSDEQDLIVKAHGSQCGFCTPGWVTNMHALNASSSSNSSSGGSSALSGRDIENYLDGNICRCTGYKPILKAFKTFAGDNDSPSVGVSGCGSGSGSGSGCGSHNPHGHGHGVSGGGACAGVCSAPANCAGGGCTDDMESLCDRKVVRMETSGSCVFRGKKSTPLGKKAEEAFVRSYVSTPLMFFNPITNKRWFRPTELDQLCAILRSFPASSVQIMVGNTSIGVTKYLNGTAPYNTPDQYDVIVDVNQISAMTTTMYDAVSGELCVGAAVTLNSLISSFQRYSVPGTSPISAVHSEIIDHSSLFSVVAHHLTMVAGTQVRNAGSWAGNLMTFLRHPSFPSDVILSFLTANATLQLCDSAGSLSVMTIQDFLQLSLQEFQRRGLFILSASFQEAKKNLYHQGTGLPVRVCAETFRVAQRARNAHAHCNAGFQFHVSGSRGAPLQCLYARVVFGGVSEKTFIATRTEAVLRNAYLTAATLAQALAALDEDLAYAGPSTAFGDQSFRYSVMQSCLYRAFLRCYPVEDLPSSVVSAVLPWVKPVSRGTELYVESDESKPDEVPVGKAVTKLEAPMQSTGEAMYPSDETLPPQGLHAAIVYSRQAAVQVLGFDLSAASAIPGFVRFISAADIPGSNSVGAGIPLFVAVGDVALCVGAPLGLVVCSTEVAANQAAAAVKVIVSGPVSDVITNVDDAIAKESFYDLPSNIPSLTLIRAGNPEAAMKSAYRRVQGHIAATGQSHLYMETNNAVAFPVDGDFVDITCGTQDAVGMMTTVASVLNVPHNKVVVKVPRLGGSFGAKITRGNTVAAASALAATLLRRPVRIFNSRTADMAMTGGRESFAFDYEIGFSADGTITAVRYDFYIDAGMAKGDAIGGLYMGMHWADNAYYFPNYVAHAKLCFTNTPARTSMRAPGVVQACLATEVLIERVAVELGLPVTAVQEKNFVYDGATTITGQPIERCTLPTVWSTLLRRSLMQERLARAQSFNSSNLWRKRGLSVCPVKYGIGWSGYNAGVRLGVSASDGTVIVSSSGAEAGQGLNTKLAQAVAYELGIDLSLVRVTYTGTDKVANGGVTGGSGTSEVVVQAALNACVTLNTRLDPYRPGLERSRVGNKLGAGGRGAKRGGGGGGVGSQGVRGLSISSTEDWVSLLGSLPSDVSLNTEGWYSPTDNPNGQEFQYFVYAACVSEVELDVLSGEVQVLAAEIVYDCGQSLNPTVDIGQIEGAFVMGLGYFLTESVQYDSAGNLLTNGTFEYKPPMVKEIPSVFNVTLLRNVYNTDGILGSKAVGEPPYVTANSIYFAVKMALASARADAGDRSYFALQVPAIVEARQQAALVTPSRFLMPF